MPGPERPSEPTRGRGEDPLQKMMNAPSDFDPNKDYVVKANGRVLGYMRAQWGNAASQILVAWEPGDGEREWHATGRQVADYRHSSLAAARAEFSDEVDDEDEITAE